MALVEEKYIESTDGIKKTIDKGSMGIALDILQRGLYAYPIQSTVRELASNGYDAVKERDVAKALISGAEKVEDHFDVTKIDGVFHASGWDPTYFDLAWLSDDPCTYIYYEEGSVRDTLRIVDHGVGLGKNRLVNYFMLNWSSKRANKDSLGRFGLGSKVALSLGVDSFRVITKYNGKKFKFDVFLDKVESIIPKFNSKGQPNEPFILVPEKHTNEDDGTVTIIPAYVAYCEQTTDKNGVEIQIEVKKHNKKLFFEGIESQLMYMPGIKFLYKEEGKSVHTVKDIAAKIMYKDDNVVISESTVFDKPHILLGTGNALINYGFVSFKDLELEPKRGSVGLIMDINDIEVTPSRESPVWSAKTRAAVLDKYKQVSAMASQYLNKELASENDYLKWVSKAAQIIGSMRHGSGSSTTVLSRLASIIDMDDIGKVTYPGDTRIIFEPKLTEMVGKSLTVRYVKYDSSRKKIERKFMEDLGYLSYPVYFTSKGSDPMKDRYLFEEKGIFVLINIKENATVDMRGNLVLTSTLLNNYDAVTVPQDRLDLYLTDAQDLAEDDDTGGKVAPKVDYSASRKANKQVVLHVLSGEGYSHDYKFSTEDVYISDLFNRYKDKLVIYSAGGDRDKLSDLLAIFPKSMLSIKGDKDLAEFMKISQTMLPTYDLKTRIVGVLLAQENIKYVQNSTRYISMTDVMMKKYDSKTETLVFSDLMKFAATLSFMYKYCADTFGVHTLRTFNNKALTHFDERFFTLSNFLDTYYYPKASNDYYRVNPPRDIFSDRGDEFLKSAAYIQLYKEGILEASDEAIADLVKTINTKIPDYLCDTVDNIENTDIIYVDEAREFVKFVNYYGKEPSLVELMAKLSYYDDAGAKRLSPPVHKYYKYINNVTS